MLVRATGAPSGLVAGAPRITGVGGKLVTPIVSLYEPPPPSSSLTARLTTYDPSSSGVKLNPGLVPEAKRAPFFVTVQAYVKVSAEPGSMTLLVRLIVVPSGLLAGALSMVALVCACA